MWRYQWIIVFSKILDHSKLKLINKEICYCFEIVGMNGGMYSFEQANCFFH